MFILESSRSCSSAGNVEWFLSRKIPACRARGSIRIRQILTNFTNVESTFAAPALFTRRRPRVGHICKFPLTTSAAKCTALRGRSVARARKSGEHTDYEDAGVVEEREQFAQSSSPLGM